jgi:hypothetical protein
MPDRVSDGSTGRGGTLSLLRAMTVGAGNDHAASSSAPETEKVTAPAPVGAWVYTMSSASPPGRTRYRRSTPGQTWRYHTTESSDSSTSGATIPVGAAPSISAGSDVIRSPEGRTMVTPWLVEPKNTWKLFLMDRAPESVGSTEVSINSKSPSPVS